MFISCAYTSHFILPTSCSFQSRPNSAPAPFLQFRNWCRFSFSSGGVSISRSFEDIQRWISLKNLPSYRDAWSCASTSFCLFSYSWTPASTNHHHFIGASHWLPILRTDSPFASTSKYHMQCRIEVKDMSYDLHVPFSILFYRVNHRFRD